MSDTIRTHVRDIFIVTGLFVPLINYIYHLLQSYAGSVNVLHMDRSEQLILATLIVVPLLVLRMVYTTSCRHH